MVFSSIAESMGSLSALSGGRIGSRALLWYACTTTLACLQGVMWAFIYNPWNYYKSEDIQSNETLTGALPFERDALER